MICFPQHQLCFSVSINLCGTTHQSLCFPTTGNCAHFHKGGWWYNACGQTNLNGVWYTGGVYRSKFQDGIFWADYGGGFYSMKSVRMLIRPIDWGDAGSQAGPGQLLRPGQTWTSCLIVTLCHQQLDDWRWKQKKKLNQWRLSSFVTWTACGDRHGLYTSTALVIS